MKELFTVKRRGPSDKFAMSLKALTDDEKTELKDQFTVLDKL